MSDRLPVGSLLIFVAAVILVLSIRSLCRTAISNEQFCTLAMAELADSLVSRLQLEPGVTIKLLPIEQRFGEELTQQLADRLHKTGVVVYLGEAVIASEQALKTTIGNFSLSYQRQGDGLFSRGKVKRTLSLTASGTLQAVDGQLLRVISVPLFVRSDLLSAQEAFHARGGDGFLAPEIPLSFQQRFLEPSLMVLITGTLVYLFFASR